MWVKICGIRDLKTAGDVAALGPDAIGLNFYDGSPRRVEIDVAAEIVRRLPSGVEPVGVFVNHAVEDVIAIASHCGLTTVQMHGDETAHDLSELQHRSPALKIIRAHRLGREGSRGLADYLAECRKLGVRLMALLVDAHVDGAYGGTGKSVAWDEIAPNRREADWPPFILAGGLTPDTVATGIAAVQPWGVDVASGVESEPGGKDFERVKSFIDAARRAQQ